MPGPTDFVLEQLALHHAKATFFCIGDNIRKHPSTFEKILKEKTENWFKNFPIVGDARGLGPMRAIELVKNRETKEPNPEAVKQIQKFCYEKGLILMNAGTFGNVIRFLPPLCMEETVLLEGLEIVQRALEATTISR